MGKRPRRVGRVVVFAIAVVGVAALVVPGIITAELFKRSFGDNTSLDDWVGPRYEYVDAAAYPRSEFTFEAQGNTLHGYRYDTDNPCGLAVFAHGLNSNNNALLPLITHFVDQGWMCVSFDGTSAGDSEGDAVRGLCQTKYDLEGLLDYIGQQPDLAALPLVTIGHSMGGYAVTASLADGYRPDAVVCLSAVNSADDTMSALVTMYGGPLGWLCVPHVWIQNRLAFGADADITGIDGINAAGDTPVLCIYGSEDEAVPPYRSGILAHADAITNPNFTSIVIDEPYRSTHSTVWLTTDSAQYSLEQWERQNALREEYGKPLPADVYQQLLVTIDTTRLGQADPVMAQTIERFCRTHGVSTM